MPDSETAEYQLFWLTQMVNALVHRLGDEVTVTDEELKNALDLDSSWQDDGDRYRIMVR
jgi:hypothetical protein